MRNIIYLSILFLFSACSLSPDLKNIKPKFDENIIMDKNSTNSIEANISKQWWKSFNDDKLNEIVDLALKNNTDLKITYIRLEQANAQLGISFSDLLPKLDASASAAREKSSINNPKNQSGKFIYGNDYKMGLNLSYEVDLWGKYRDNYKASKAALKASQYDFETARLSLISNVVKTYFNLASSIKNINNLNQAYEASLKIYEDSKQKYELGVINEYDLNQAKISLNQTLSTLNQEKLNKENYEKALKILASNDLNDILYSDFINENYNTFKEYSSNLPNKIQSTILMQRPDIQSSLNTLMQKNYLIGVARSAFLPSLSLNALLGFESSNTSNLTKNNSGTWNIGANALMPIFHWGEIANQVDIAKLTKDEAFLNYENTLKTAFSEIRFAFQQKIINQQQFENDLDLLKAQEKDYEFATIRYESGDFSFKDFLESKQNLMNARVKYNNSMSSYASSIVDLVKAFGGGFNANDNSRENIIQMKEILKETLN